jgi:hypothetical protein
MNFILLNNSTDHPRFNVPDDDDFVDALAESIERLDEDENINVLLGLVGYTVVGFIDFSVRQTSVSVDFVKVSRKNLRQKICTNLFRYLCRIVYYDFNATEIELWNTGGYPSFKCYYNGSRELFPFIVFRNKLLTSIPQDEDDDFFHVDYIFHFLSNDHPRIVEEFL